MQTRSQAKHVSYSKPNITIQAYGKGSRLYNSSSSSPVTRSQTQSDKQVFDFDTASEAWLHNKNKLENGMFSYKSMQNAGLTGITTRSGFILSA